MDPPHDEPPVVRSSSDEPPSLAAFFGTCLGLGSENVFSEVQIVDLDDVVDVVLCLI